MEGIKIKDLKPGMKNIVLKASVKSKEIVVASSKPLARALVADDTGELILNLWRDQIGQVSIGDNIIVKEGFARMWKGKMELNTWSAIEVISKNK